MITYALVVYAIMFTSRLFLYLILHDVSNVVKSFLGYVYLSWYMAQLQDVTYRYEYPMGCCTMVNGMDHAIKKERAHVARSVPDMMVQ